MPGHTPDPKDIHLCIFTPENNAYSETFIQNHIKWLPFQKTILNGTGLANLSFEGKPLYPPTFINRLRSKLLGPAKRRSHQPQKQALRAFLRRHRIQVVLAEYGHIATIIREACQELGIPLVAHFHGNDASHRPTIELLKDEYRALFAYASAIISVSQAMSLRLRHLGAPAEKIVFNCYGIDTELFNHSPASSAGALAESASGNSSASASGPAAGHPTAHPSGHFGAYRSGYPTAQPLEPPTFVAIGRFVEKKAPHLSIMAFAMAKEQIPSIRLIMIGNGPLLEPCRQLARAIGIGECIEFAGVRTPAEISSTLSRARAFIQHSVVASDGNAEGTPLSVLEAGACGVPVISTRHEGIAEVVIEGQTGILVNEFDVKAMAEAIQYLATDAEAAKRMGAAAREHIRRSYRLDRHIDTLKQVILDSYRSAGTSRIQA